MLNVPRVVLARSVLGVNDVTKAITVMGVILLRLCVDIVPLGTTPMTLAKVRVYLVFQGNLTTMRVPLNAKNAETIHSQH